MNKNDLTLRMILLQAQDKEAHPLGCAVESSHPDYTTKRLAAIRKQLGLTHVLTISRRDNDEIWIIRNAEKE